MDLYQKIKNFTSGCGLGKVQEYNFGSQFFFPGKEITSWRSYSQGALCKSGAYSSWVWSIILIWIHQPLWVLSESHLYKVEVELKGRWPQGTESSESNNPMHVSHMWAHFWWDSKGLKYGPHCGQDHHIGSIIGSGNMHMLRSCCPYFVNSSTRLLARPTHLYTYSLWEPKLELTQFASSATSIDSSVSGH